MTDRKPRKKPTSLVAAAGPALRRAAKDARRIAKMHGTTVVYEKNGKIVIERPLPSGICSRKHLGASVLPGVCREPP